MLIEMLFNIACSVFAVASSQPASLPADRVRPSPEPSARKAAAHLADSGVVHLVPQAVGPAHKGDVVAGVQRVPVVHQHPKQAVRLRGPPPVRHVRPQVQVRVEVDSLQD